MSKIVFDAEKARRRISVSLPSFPGTELNFYVDLTVWEERELSQKYPKYRDENHSDSFDFVVDTISTSLISWNFTDKDDQDIPTTEAPTLFKKLPTSDLKYIIDKIREAKEQTVGGLGLELLQK